MNTEKIMEDIQSVQDNIREIKSTWGNTIMTLDNIKSGLKADVQKKVDEAYQRGHDDGYEAGCATAFKPVSDAAYQRGLEDAWEAARKLFSSMADSDIEKAFPIEWNNGGFKALMNLQPQEAIAKLKAYEDKHSDRIEVGDIVDRYIDGKFDSRGIYLGGNGEIWDCLFWANTLPITLAYPKGQFKKTGKHYDIQSILEAMRT